MHTFRHAIHSQDFAISAEIRLESDTNSEAILDQVTGLPGLVDAVQVTDNPRGNIHLSPIAACSVLLNAGIDPVMHITCRDRNGIALRSDLLGAAALGVTSILVRRGDNLPRGADSKVATVFDWGVDRLIAEARSLQTDPPFRKPVELLIGSAAVAFKPDKNWAPEKVSKKVSAGAQFIQTQPCFDIELLRHYAARLVSLRLIEKVDIVASLAVLPNVEVARWMAKNLRGAAMPAKIVKRLRHASDSAREGIDICSELLAECAKIPGINGANIISLGNMDSLKEAIAGSGLRD